MYQSKYEGFVKILETHLFPKMHFSLSFRESVWERAKEKRYALNFQAHSKFKIDADLYFVYFYIVYF